MDKTFVLKDRQLVVATQKVTAALGDQHPQPMIHIKKIQNAVSSPIVLAVMGEFSAGKSTFINRVLGIDALPVSILPKTATITKLMYGEEPCIEVESQIGNEIFIRKSQGYDGLKEIQNAKNIGNADFLREIEVIREVRVYVKNELLKRFTLLDTPGFNHDEAMDKKTTECLNDVDLIIWLSVHAQLATKTEFERIEQLRQSVKHLYLVINKADVHIDGSDEYKSAYDDTLLSLQKNGFADLFDEKEKVYLISCKTSIDFWDGKFQQFIATFGREVLGNDLKISIHMIALAWGELQESIQKELHTYEQLNEAMGALQQLMDVDALITECYPKVKQAIQQDLNSLFEYIDVQYKKGESLATKIDAANNYMGELLFLDVKERIEDVETQYTSQIHDIKKDHFLCVCTALQNIIDIIPEQMSIMRSNINHIKSYFMLGLNFSGSSIKLTLPAVQSIVQYLYQEKKSLGVLATATKAIKSQKMKEDVFFEYDFQDDMRILFHDDALHETLKDVEAKQVKAVDQLHKAKTIMENTQ